MRNIILAILFLPILVYGNDQDATEAQYNPVFLSCLIESTGYKDMEPGNITINAGLVLPYKEEKGGHFKLLDTDQYEFWIFAYGYSEANNVIDIGSFQVAIKEKASGNFMHATSNIDYMNPGDEGYRPKSARLSLVDYEPDSFVEKGELLFMCNQVTESPLDNAEIEEK